MRQSLPRMAPGDLARAKAFTRMRPFNCVWELTLACNLRCTHCGSNAGKARRDELSTIEALSVVDQLAELDCELITLSGGEPTLRDDWDVIARAVHDRGVKVNMVTNAITMNAAMVERVRASGLCNVGVSIDGRPEVHDRIRGVGMYARSSRGVRGLIDAGVSVSVMTTINQANIDHLAEIRQQAIDWGARMWRLQLGKPMGSMGAELVITPEQLRDLVPWLAEMKRDDAIHLAVGDSIGYYGAPDKVLRGRSWRGRTEQWAGCQAGMRAIGVESDGGVKGCLSMQAQLNPEAAHEEGDPFWEGSLRQRALADIWFDADAFAYNRQFDPASLEGYCATCAKARACRGGARCVSSAFDGKLTEDRYCHWRLTHKDRPEGMARTLAKSAAAAALVLSLSGCLESDRKGTTIQSQDVQTSGQDANVNPDTGESDAGVQPDYGVPPDVIDPDVQMEYGVPPDADDPDVQMDYGVPPDAGDPDVQMDYGVPPDADDPDVQMDYGVPPDAGDPDVQMEYGMPPDGGGETIDCDTVCCECDYGVIPDEVWKECCDPCADVCCDCEYGAPPPPECCE